MLLRSDLLKIRTPGVSFHALRDDTGLHLIDTGFIGASSLLAKALNRHDGDHFPIWHGLRAIHLPGHTPGHTGFHCQNLRLLFCADLFASYGPLSHLPPRIFNSSPNQIPASLQKALSLDLTGLAPNHADNATPAIHLHRLKKLAPTLKESDPP
jgi:glyoxylase-like metal-dependent hydrolase (beta-lactamase superfamily II)